MSARKNKQADPQQQQQQQYDGSSSSDPSFQQFNFQQPAGPQFSFQSTVSQPHPQAQPDVAAFQKLQDQVSRLTKELKSTSKELEELKSKTDQSRSSREFSFGNSSSLQSTSALNLSNVSIIGKNEPIANFMERFSEFARGVDAPETVQREVLYQKVAPRCDIPLLFGPKLKTMEVMKILEAMGDRVRDRDAILKDLMSLELSTKYGCRKFCERHARLVNEAKAHPELKNLEEDFFLGFIRDAVGPRTRDVLLKDDQNAATYYVKLMQLDNLGQLFERPAKSFRKDNRRDRSQRPRYKKKDDQRQLTQPKGDGHRADHMGKDTRSDGQSRGGSRGSRGHDQRPRYQGPQKSRAVNVVDEYDDDEFDDEVDDRYDDQQDDYEQEVRPSSYAIKVKHPRINYPSLYALVDTGASRSIIATQLAKEWGCKIEPHGGPRFRAANNSSVHISGVTTVPLVLGTKIVKIMMLAASSISTELILGADFLNQHQAVIDVPSRLLRLERIGDLQLHTRSSDAVLMSLHRRFEANPKQVKQADQKDKKETAFGVTIDPNNALSKEDRQKFVDLVAKYPELWSLKKGDINPIPVEEVGFEVTTKKEIAIYRKSRLSAVEEAAVEETVKELLDSGVIRPSESGHNYPLVIVPKPPGIRVVFDFSPLNPYIVDVAFPMPVVDDILDQLGGSTIFAVLDARSGFHQIAIKEECRHYLAFSTRSGKFEFNRLPMGLKISPAIFQRAMIKILRGLKFVHIFVDDILVVAQSPSQLLENLDVVFKRLKNANVLLNAQKCKIGCDKVKYLGHIISKEGVSPDPTKVQGIRDLAAPKNLKGVQQLMGLINYQRRFIKDCSAICAPISKLTRGKVRFEWGDEQKEAFEKLKVALTADDIMAYPDHDVRVPYTLHVDTSRVGVGAILMQKGRVICYSSVKLDKHQVHYGASELEAFGLYWALKNVRHYVLGHHVDVECDHRALQYIKAGMTTNSKLARWFSALSEFDFTIKYTPGEKMQHVDALSRLVSAISEYSPVDPNRIAKEQKKDKFCQVIASNKDDSFVRHKGLWCLKDEDNHRIVVPESMRLEVIRHLHDSVSAAGHRGIDATIRLVRENFFWPSLAKDVREFVLECVACQRRKSPTIGKQGYMMPTTTDNAWERLACDIVGPVIKTIRGNCYYIVITDLFSKFSLAFPMKDTKAETVANILAKKVFAPFGLPKELLTDNGTNFRSKIMSTLCKSYNIKKIFTAPYRPQTDGQCERTNRVIGDTLSMTVNDNCDDWDLKLHLVTQSYNSIVHSATGFTPYEIIFGRKPRTPTQLALDINVDRPADERPTEERFKEIHDQARRKLDKERTRQKVQYDKTTHDPIPYRVGDIVLIKKEDHRASKSNKFDHKWTGPFEIVREINQVAFRIKRCFSSGRSQTVNVNNMKPFCQPSKGVFTTLTDDELHRWKKEIGDLSSDKLLSFNDGNTSFDLNDDNVYEVDKILIFRIVDGQKELFLTWKGFPNERSWVHETQCRCKDNVLEFFSSRALRRIH